MSIIGNQLYRDGQVFLPRGFNFIGILAPDNCATPASVPLQARASLGSAELLAARDQWDANTVRFQVSQTGLDPQNPTYTPAYVERVTAAVAMARSLGLTVILSMQDQSYSCGTSHPLPSDMTVRSWQNLAPLFTNDPYVMFELFNEPKNQVDAASWAEWKNGGSGPLANQGAPVIGHQALVQTVRDLGANNIVIADGANLAGRLQGLPLLADPLVPSQIMYGWHPYSYHVSGGSTLATDQANWNTRTAAVLAAAPVIATEWNAGVSNCTAGADQRVPDLLSYLQEKRIGLLGHAFDVVGTMVQDLITWTPTSLTGYGCKVVGPDAGLLVQADFQAQAGSDHAPDTTVPTVTLTSPVDQAVVRQTVRVTGAASDDTGVTSVDLLVDGVAVAAATDDTLPSVAWDSASVADGIHTLQFQAQDAAGHFGLSALVSVTVGNGDVSAPSTPDGLSASASGATAVQLSWHASSDDMTVAGYHVFRDGSAVASVTEGLAYLDAGVTEATTYTYQVDAFDAAGNTSVLSDTVTVTTPAAADTTAPSIPLGLKLTTVASNSVTFAWTASTDDVGVVKYNVYRGTALVGTSTQPGYTDAGLGQGQTYSYSVSAADAAGNVSARSSALAVKVADSVPPSVPTGFTATAGSKRVALSWKASTDNVGVKGYYVLRNGVRIATVSSGTAFTDTGLTSKVKHGYTVRSFDAAGNLSALTASISIAAK